MAVVVLIYIHTGKFFDGILASSSIAHNKAFEVIVEEGDED